MGNINMVSGAVTTVAGDIGTATGDIGTAAVQIGNAAVQIGNAFEQVGYGLQCLIGISALRQAISALGESRNLCANYNWNYFTGSNGDINNREERVSSENNSDIDEEGQESLFESLLVMSAFPLSILCSK
jgi:hypothetical protein